MFRSSLSNSRAATRSTPRQATDTADTIENREYLGYLDAVGHGIGELAPLDGESAGGIAASLTDAAMHAGLDARVWIDAGRVYFFVRRDHGSGW